MSLHKWNPGTEGQQIGRGIQHPETTRKSLRLQQKKLESEAQRMDASWAEALNRAKTSTRIQQSFLRTARGDGRNLAGPRDIIKAPGLPKIALFLQEVKKEEPQDSYSDSSNNLHQLPSPRSKDAGIGTTPTLGSVCHCGFQEKFHELEKVLKEKDLEVEQLKQRIQTILKRSARAGAELLEVVVNHCELHDVKLETAEAGHMEESNANPDHFPFGEDSREGEPNLVPGGALLTPGPPIRNWKQSTPASTSRKGEESVKRGDPAAHKKFFTLDLVQGIHQHSRSPNKTLKTDTACSITGQPRRRLHFGYKQGIQRMFRIRPVKKRASETTSCGSGFVGTRSGHCGSGRWFSRRNKLKQRVAVPFQCPQPNCVAQFWLCSGVKMHVRRCHGPPDYDVYGCYECGATFPSRPLLLAHFK